MTATQGNLAGLSRFIFRAPNWYASLAFALCIAALAGVAAFDTSGYFLQDAWEGVFFIGIPTVVAAFATTMVDRWLGGHMTHNRSSLLALTSEMLLVGILTVVGIVAVLTPLGQEFVYDALIVGLASVLALRLLIIQAVSRTPFLLTLVPASIQTGVAAILLFIYSGALRFFEVGGPLVQVLFSRPQQAPPGIQQSFLPIDFVLLGVLCIVYVASVWLFLVVLDRPWRSTLGVSGLDFLQGFIGHIAEGTRELEDFFETLGEEAIVPVTVLSIRKPAGSEKARFVLPMIHPGPMGDIGGGNLPKRVALEADGVAFPPHATAGHDFNLVTEREVDTILSAAETAYQRIEYTDVATRSVRLQEGEVTLTGQAFGEDVLVVSTFSPGFADDVEYAVGLSATSEAHVGDLDDVMFVDAHNCNDGLDGDDLGHVVPGSQRSFDVIYGAGRLGDRLSDADRKPLRYGVAWDKTPWNPSEGIGPLGIRVAVFEVDGQTTAYVLIDGNNMEPGLRETIVSTVDSVDSLEVMTTDTHIVNTVDAVNQVGGALPDDDLITLIEDLVERAVADLEPVETGMASEKATVTVFGNDRTETLASTANVVVSMGGALAAAFVLVVLVVSVLIFFLANGGG